MSPGSRRPGQEEDVTQPDKLLIVWESKTPGGQPWDNRRTTPGRVCWHGDGLWSHEEPKKLRGRTLF